MKNIMIIGAGAVSGFFGALLTRTNPDISFLLRSKTLEAVKENGLTIRSQAVGTFIVHPMNIASDPSQLPSPDLIVLGIKGYDLEETCRQIEPVLRDDSVLLTLQNGVTIEDELMMRFGQDRVVGGVAFIYSKIITPGVIEHYKRGILEIGEMRGQQTSRINQIAALFADAGITCKVSSDIRQAKWEKMCWNCVFNPLTVILDDCIATALDHPEMLSVIVTIVDEVVKVAKGLSVSLDESMSQKVVRSSQEIRDIHTSMYDDWKAGRPTEIDDLNGYIVKKGKEFGIPTPVNESLTALVKVITERKS